MQPRRATVPMGYLFIRYHPWLTCSILGRWLVAGCHELHSLAPLIRPPYGYLQSTYSLGRGGKALWQPTA